MPSENRLSRKPTILLIVLAFALTVLVLPQPRPTRAAAGKPNIIFILTDDQRADSLQVMPNTRARFPISFSPAFVVDPWCCPSRASILTGRYAHGTGVTDNSVPKYQVFEAIDHDSLGPWLQQQGYYTGFVGKYFNGFATRTSPVPPGWDEFYGFSGAGLSGTNERVYTDFPLRHRWLDGTTLRDESINYNNSYTTTVFSDLADRFIRRAGDPLYNPTDKPWALFVWPNAPHSPYTPEPKYATAGVPSWQSPPSFFEQDLSDKPQEVHDSLEKATTPEQMNWTRALHLRTLKSVDDMVARLFGTIQEMGDASRTFGIYTSDNGLMLGEHGLAGKRYAYEESIRVPFLLSIPGQPARNLPLMVTNLDIAPTLMDFAGGLAGRTFNGKPLLRVLKGQVPVRTYELLEAFGETEIAPWFRYDGLRTKRYKYIKWASGNTELYDLISDPFELNNIASSQPGVVNQLQTAVDSLKTK